MQINGKNIFKIFCQNTSKSLIFLNFSKLYKTIINDRQSAFIIIIIRDKKSLLHLTKMVFIFINPGDILKSGFVKTKGHKKIFP